MKMSKIIVRQKEAPMEIVAVRGDSEYLISIGNNQAIIVNIETKEKSAPWNVHSILARGYWKEYTGPDILSELL